MAATRWVFTFVLGIALIALGAFVAVRPLFTRAPLTAARWLDVTFAVVFILRGIVNIRTARRRRSADAARG